MRISWSRRQTTAWHLAIIACSYSIRATIYLVSIDWRHGDSCRGNTEEKGEFRRQYGLRLSTARGLVVSVAPARLRSLPGAFATGFADWSATPALGWNSWDVYGQSVTESEVRANADYMAANLKQFGWEYAVVDIRWTVPNPTYIYNPDATFTLDQNGRFLPRPIAFQVPPAARV